MVHARYHPNKQFAFATMDDLNFDIYTLVNPKDSRDMVAMLNEALDELENINSIIDKLLSNTKASK